MAEKKEELVQRLLDAKAKSGKSFSQIAEETGLTNAYVGQLFHRQAQLHFDQVGPLMRSLESCLSEELARAMTVAPTRSYDPLLIQDPTVYRLHEAVMHYARTFKAIINEEFGDGIMSAVGFYCDVSKIKGKDGEDRVLIGMNGKYLPHIVQKQEENQQF